MARGEVESGEGRTGEWADGGRRAGDRERERSREDRYSDEEELATRRKSTVVRRSPSEQEYWDYLEEKDDGRNPRRDRDREWDRSRNRRDVEEKETSKVSVGDIELGLNAKEDRSHREGRKTERYSSSSDEDSKEEEVFEGGGMKPRRHDSSHGGSEEDDIVSGTPTKKNKSKGRKREKSGRRHALLLAENEEDGVVVGTPTKKSKSRSRKREKSRKHGDRKSSKSKHERGSEDSEDSESDDPSSTSSSEISDSEDEAQREKERKRRKKRRRKEKEREQEREIRRREKRKLKELKEKQSKSEKKKRKRENRAKKPITTSWGKYGILKDIDMWNKRPEFSAWLAEVKKVNMEVLSNWEEKQMFKEYMEDYNTATFPSKKYYNLDIYHRRKMMKARMKGMAKFVKVERTDFNDEEQRRLELRKEREQKKEEDVEALMRTMQSGMAQAMREQAQLREEMQYQFRLGNLEAAQAIQRRLDPDADKLAKM